MGDLWDEFIEMATYGPGERRLLKARRAEAVARAAEGEISPQSLQRAKDKLRSKTTRTTDGVDSGGGSPTPVLSSSALRDELSLRQTTSSRTPSPEQEEATANFDGYALRDLLVARWGAPLDIEFQRGYDNEFVYCTVSPVAFGSRKCRHESEIDYLCHLQGVVETLEKYGNLGLFVEFVEGTRKVPKVGTDSVPYRLVLTEEERRKVLGKI